MAVGRDLESRVEGDPLVLLVEDNEFHAQLIQQSIERIGALVEHVTTCAAALEALTNRNFELVMLDVDLPDGNGFEVYEWLRGRSTSPLVIFVTADDRAEHAVQAVKAGAADYIVKRPSYFAEVARTVVRVLDEAAASRQLQSSDATSTPDSPIDFLGHSPEMVEVRVAIQRLSDSALPVFVYGEFGTGKTLVSQLLHNGRRRRAAPFLVVDYGLTRLIDEIPSASTPIRSDTARSSDPRVSFEAARAGTLVLKKVDLASDEAQTILTELIDADLSQAEQGRMTTRVVVDSRLDLGVEATEGRFNQDLWIRLAGQQIRICPLRQRIEDISSIISAELRRLADEAGASPLTLTDDAHARLRSHSWPGNTRELLATVRQLAADHSDRDSVDQFDVDAALSRTRDKYTPRAQYEEYARLALRAALDANDWNNAATARALGVTRSAIRRRRQSLDLVD